MADLIPWTWELSDVRAVLYAERRDTDSRLPYREQSKTRVVRLSVLADGRLGQASIYCGESEPDLVKLVNDAGADSARWGTRPDWAADHIPSANQAPEIVAREQLHALPWLESMGADEEMFTFRTRRSNGTRYHGERRDSWERLGFGGCTLARVPAGAASLPQEQPRWSGDRLLVSPWVLSGLMLEAVTRAVHSENPGRWADIPLHDPAWGPGTDIEGTHRVPFRFSAGGTWHVAADRRTSWSRGVPTTGHAGISGPVIRDLAVGPPAAETPLPALGALVLDALCVESSGAGAMVAMAIAREDTQEPVEVLWYALRHLSELLQCGRWCGPWQRGQGAWTSRWIDIERNASCLAPPTHSE